jgi:hypothetical protein
MYAETQNWIIWHNFLSTNTDQESCLYRTHYWTTGKSKWVRKCMQTINILGMSAVTDCLDNIHTALSVLMLVVQTLRRVWTSTFHMPGKACKSISDRVTLTGTP